MAIPQQPRGLSDKETPNPRLAPTHFSFQVLQVSPAPPKLIVGGGGAQNALSQPTPLNTLVNSHVRYKLGFLQPTFLLSSGKL